jgi:anti-sigma B factor antagonist
MERELVVRVVRPGAEVDLVGRLDARTASTARDLLHGCIDEGDGDLLLHVGELEIWDSTGLGVLVGALKRLRAASGTFGLVCSKEPLLKIFRITALDQVFPIYPSVEAATSATDARDGSGPTA